MLCNSYHKSEFTARPTYASWYRLPEPQVSLWQARSKNFTPSKTLHFPSAAQRFDDLIIFFSACRVLVPYYWRRFWSFLFHSHCNQSLSHDSSRSWPGSLIDIRYLPNFFATNTSTNRNRERWCACSCCASCWQRRFISPRKHRERAAAEMKSNWSSSLHYLEHRQAGREYGKDCAFYVELLQHTSSITSAI